MRTFLPTGYEPNYPYPLLVFLHGRGGSNRGVWRGTRRRGTFEVVGGVARIVVLEGFEREDDILGRQQSHD
jgi:hypothetical protein